MHHEARRIQRGAGVTEIDIVANFAMRLGARDLGNGVWRLLSYGLIPVASASLCTELADWLPVSFPPPEFLLDLGQQARTLMGLPTVPAYGEGFLPVGYCRAIAEDTIELLCWRQAV